MLAGTGTNTAAQAPIKDTPAKREGARSNTKRFASPSAAEGNGHTRYNKEVLWETQETKTRLAQNKNQ